MSDRIVLSGLRVFGRHGVFPHERETGQTFEVDLVLVLTTGADGAARATTTDDLADTVDYGAVALQVAAVIGGEPVNLIETLAQRVADAVLTDARLEEVQVTVHKPQAPVPVPFRDVAVTLTRRRP